MASSTSSGKKLTYPVVDLPQQPKPKYSTPKAKAATPTSKAGTGTQGGAKTLPPLPSPPKITGSGSGAGNPNPNAIGASGDPRNIGSQSTVNAQTAAPTGSGFPQPGQMANGDPFGGFASRYRPQSVGELYSNPQLIANDVLKSLGYGANVGLQSSLGDIAQVAPTLGFLSTAPQGQNAQGDEDMINQIAAILGQQATVGGQGIDYRSMLSNIFGSDPQSGLIARYASLDPSGAPAAAGDQMSAVKQLISAALTNVNPFAQRAMMGMTGNMLNNWQSSLASSQQPVGTALQYLKGNNLLGQFY